jgi:hypothetical protein
LSSDPYETPQIIFTSIVAEDIAEVNGARLEWEVLEYKPNLSLVLNKELALNNPIRHELDGVSL